MGQNTLDGRSEIAFFDLETTVPRQQGQKFSILEFGAILVCPRKLEELHSYSTLVRPSDLSLISQLSERCNGITREDVASAPAFADIADMVYDVLNGRIWAGHNILKFDCPRIREAFGDIGRTPPEPKGIIDTLALLTQKFGKRAGNMKMASLAAYFRLGQQTHRSLDDVRMNFEVLKYCATVLFLESSLPDLLTPIDPLSPGTETMKCRNSKAPSKGINLGRDTLSAGLGCLQNSPIHESSGENHPVISHVAPSVEADIPISVSVGGAQRDPFDMRELRNETSDDSLEPSDDSIQKDISMEDNGVQPAVSEGCSGFAGFLYPDEVYTPDIKAILVPFYRGAQRIKLLHKDTPMQLCCSDLKVRFGISRKFVDYAGRPRLSIVVDLCPSLFKVLEASDGVARKLSIESGSGSDWRPVTIKNGFFNNPAARLHIPLKVIGDTLQYGTEIYKKEPYGSTRKLVFTEFDVSELEHLFKPGTVVDAFMSLDTYDYQQSAGIRLVAKKLIIVS